MQCLIINSFMKTIIAHLLLFALKYASDAALEFDQ